MKSLRSTGSGQAARAWLQEGGMALEEALVGQHAQAGRAVAGVAGGDVGGHEVSRACTPLLGLAFLTSAITAGAAGGDLGAQCRRKPRTSARLVLPPAAAVLQLTHAATRAAAIFLAT